MPYLDIHFRTPEMHDAMFASVPMPETEDLGKDVRNLIFTAVPDATDYTFKEVSVKEVNKRERLKRMDPMVRMVIRHASLQMKINNTRGA